MNDETINRLIDQLGPVTEKLGEGAEHVYGLAVRQAVINGVTDLILTAIFAVLVYACYRIIMTCRAKIANLNEQNKGKVSYERADTDGWIGMGIAAALLGLTFLGFAIGQFASGIRALLNPHWAAFEIIMNTVVGS